MAFFLRCYTDFVLDYAEGKFKRLAIGGHVEMFDSFRHGSKSVVLPHGGQFFVATIRRLYARQ